MRAGARTRRCHLVATAYAKQKLNVTACISGGLQSLVMSNELPEDDPEAGAADFQAALGDAQDAMLIGVSCGLSADYVAGALQYAMQQGFAVAALGFNPPTEARTDLFCKVIAEMLHERDDRVLLTPIVGPEAIAGSSRMKGGSASFIWLDVRPPWKSVFFC